ARAQRKIFGVTNLKASDVSQQIARHVGSSITPARMAQHGNQGNRSCRASSSCHSSCAPALSASGAVTRAHFDHQEQNMSQEFHNQLIEFLPRMRVWALALTRNRAAAEDLTQDVATKVLLAEDCFTPGTNFSAWVHRIMVNHFISSVRSKREFTDVENVPETP